jgi:hypothetical protein
MALDPRIRAELERRGPANVRELLRNLAGPGGNAPVQMQLAGVADPIRADVEDWLREKEQETETVMRATLQWATTAGRVAIIGVLATAGLGIAGLIIGIRSCSYTAATYDDTHRPRVEFGNFHVQGIGNDLFFIQDVFNHSDNEDAANINIKSEGINLKTKRTEPEPDVTWPHLAHGQYDQFRIKLNSTDYPYLLMCITYRSEKGKAFSDHAFFVVAGLQAGMTSGEAPPSREDQDALEANFPCANVK